VAFPPSGFVSEPVWARGFCGRFDNDDDLAAGIAVLEAPQCVGALVEGEAGADGRSNRARFQELGETLVWRSNVLDVAIDTAGATFGASSLNPDSPFSSGPPTDNSHFGAADPAAPPSLPPEPAAGRPPTTGERLVDLGWRLNNPHYEQTHHTVIDELELQCTTCHRAHHQAKTEVE